MCFINKWLTLKSQEANIRSGGMNRVLGRAVWLSTLIPRLSLIWEHKREGTYWGNILAISQNTSLGDFWIKFQVFAVTGALRELDITTWKPVFLNYQSQYLGQLVPELIQVAEDLGMDLRAPDVVNIPQNAQNPPPEYKGRISMPSSQTATGDDADVIGQKLTAVCTQNRSDNTSQRTEQ